jgi:hypothetical protein
MEVSWRKHGSLLMCLSRDVTPTSRAIMAPLYIRSEIPDKGRIQVISLHSPLFNLFSHWLWTGDNPSNGSLYVACLTATIITVHSQYGKLRPLCARQTYVRMVTGTGGSVSSDDVVVEWNQSCTFAAVLHGTRRLQYFGWSVICNVWRVKCVCLLWIYLGTKSVELSTTREATSCAATRQSPAFYGNWRFIIEFTRALHLYLSWAQPIQTNKCYCIDGVKAWRIGGSHGGDYEECRLLGYCAVWILLEPTFRRNISPPSSG